MIRSEIFSSLAILPTPDAIPTPRLTIAVDLSSMAALRSTTFFSSSSNGGTDSNGTRISPESAGLYWLSKFCMWYSASDTTTQSTIIPGIRTSRASIELSWAIRSTWQMTTPPEFRADSASERFSRLSDSLSRTDVSLRVCGGSPDEGDVDRSPREIEDLFVVEMQQLNEILSSRLVDLRTLEPGIDERLKPHSRQSTVLTPSDVAVEVNDHSLREVVRLDRVVTGKLLDLRYQPVVTTDDPLQQTLVPESVQATLGTVADAASEHQSEVLGLGRYDESLFKPNQRGLGCCCCSLRRRT